MQNVDAKYGARAKIQPMRIDNNDWHLLLCYRTYRSVNRQRRNTGPGGPFSKKQGAISHVVRDLARAASGLHRMHAPPCRGGAARPAILLLTRSRKVSSGKVYGMGTSVQSYGWSTILQLAPHFSVSLCWLGLHCSSRSLACRRTAGRPATVAAFKCQASDRSSWLQQSNAAAPFLWRGSASASAAALGGFTCLC